MKKCIVTGAAGFTGCNLVERLLAAGYFVYCVVRENSAHNKRLENLANVQLVYADLAEYKNLHQQIQEPCEMFFHLAWQGGSRYDFAAQYQNVEDTLGALEAAKKIGCKRFICTGSQAEYGPHQDLITEETCPHPIDAYGSAKLAACILTRQRAMDLGIEWIWGRIFSLYGKYEAETRMLPALVKSLRENKDFQMATDGRQNWDYLYVSDGAEALIALLEKGKNGEIYNIAHGNYRMMREFVGLVEKFVGNTACVVYDETNISLYSLQPSSEKLKRDTGWLPQVEFCSGLEFYGRKM